MVYEYKCIPCELLFERSANVKARCPNCKKVAKRVFSLAGIKFLGTGWGGYKKKFD